MGRNESRDKLAYLVAQQQGPSIVGQAMGGSAKQEFRRILDDPPPPLGGRWILEFIEMIAVSLHIRVCTQLHLQSTAAFYNVVIHNSSPRS